MDRPHSYRRLRRRQDIATPHHHRIFRVLTAAVITFATGLINLLRSDKINKHIEGGNAGTTLNIVPPRYVPEKKGSQHRDDLVQAFSSQPHQEYFHKISSLSAESIAARYGIPQTDRSIECNLNGTTQVG